MPLDLPNGAVCFVDSNVLYYSLVLTPDVSDSCAKFVDRILAGEIIANCTVSVLADVVHKVMMYEAAVKTGRPRSGIVGWLKRHPETVGTLTEFNLAAQRLSTLPLNLLAVDPAVLVDAAGISAKHSLLTGDATIVALMGRHGINHLATNDNDFDGVPNITVWKPQP
ncbi:MAG TPA: type II toxin-antitoxin system VapC family toxin [Pirellulales bacterium]